jgi:hypothetical protein
LLVSSGDHPGKRLKCCPDGDLCVLGLRFSNSLSGLEDLGSHPEDIPRRPGKLALRRQELSTVSSLLTPFLEDVDFGTLFLEYKHPDFDGDETFALKR